MVLTLLPAVKERFGVFGAAVTGSPPGEFATAIGSVCVWVTSVFLFEGQTSKDNALRVSVRPAPAIS